MDDQLIQRPETSMNKRRGPQLGLQLETNSQTFSSELTGQRAQSAQSRGFKKLQIPSTTSQATLKELGFLPNPQQQQQQYFSQLQNSINKSNLINNKSLPQMKSLLTTVQQKDYVRTIPKNIGHDKEKLYEELIKAREEINNQKYVISTSRAKINQLEEEILKFKRSNEPNTGQDLIQSTQTIKNPGKNMGGRWGPDASFIPNLRKQVENLQNEIRQKDKDLQTIKRNVKLTKIQELEVEIKAYSDETIRLKQLLQQQLRYKPDEQFDADLPEKFFKLQGQNENQKNQIEQLQIKINQYVTDEEQLKSRIKELERNVYKQSNEKTKLKKAISEQERELNRYRNQESQFLKNKLQEIDRGTTEGQLKLELERKIIENNNLTTMLALRERKIQEIERKMKENEEDHQERFDEVERNMEILRQRSEKDRADMLEWKEKYDQIVFNKKTAQRLPVQEGMVSRTSFIQNDAPGNTVNTEPGSQSKNPQKKQIKSITMKDLEIILLELKYKLQLKKIELTQIDQYLFTQENLSKGNITYQELENAFSRQPFAMNNLDNIQLLTCYLIDENHQNNKIDPQKFQSIGLVRGLFKQIMENYQIWRPSDEKKWMAQLSQLLVMHKEQILEDLRSKNLDLQNIPRNTFLEALLILDLSQVDQDLLFCKYFEKSKQITSIDFNLLCGVFQGDKKKEEKKVTIYQQSRESKIYHSQSMVNVIAPGSQTTTEEKKTVQRGTKNKTQILAKQPQQKLGNESGTYNSSFKEIQEHPENLENQEDDQEQQFHQVEQQGKSKQSSAHHESDQPEIYLNQEEKFGFGHINLNDLQSEEENSEQNPVQQFEDINDKIIQKQSDQQKINQLNLVNELLGVNIRYSELKSNPLSEDDPEFLNSDARTNSKDDHHRIDHLDALNVGRNVSIDINKYSEDRLDSEQYDSKKLSQNQDSSEKSSKGKQLEIKVNKQYNDDEDQMIEEEIE